MSTSTSQPLALPDDMAGAYIDAIYVLSSARIDVNA
jgi:hypothetical protein